MPVTYLAQIKKFTQTAEEMIHMVTNIKVKI